MSDYLLQHGTRETPQREPTSPTQVPNSEGGYVWELDVWARLRRFLILGSEGGSFYATERDLTLENVKVVRECIQADGARAVQEIADVSRGGKAPKNDPALYALAAAISLGDKATKSAAAEALPAVARIGTHLYHFVAYAETMRGWGRTMRWAIQNWYDRNSEQLALQAVKYRQRDGWSHRDLLRLAHPERGSDVQVALFDWITHGTKDWGSKEWVADGGEGSLDLIGAFEQAQRATTAEVTARLVRQFNLPREALIPEHLNSPEVWRALLEMGMPLMALIRNLATMTRHGVLTGEHLKIVRHLLSTEEELRKARIHPVAVLIALRTYASGQGFRGSNTWTPIPDVIDALDEAFYLAFDNVEPTGKDILLGIDVSGSMSGYLGGVAGSPLTAREAAVAMALVSLHVEPNVTVVGFTNRCYTLPLSRRQRLDDALRSVPQTGEGTDCAVPVAYALAGQHKYDAIVLYTDNETWAGPTHVHQAISQLRNLSGIPTRLVACGMVASSFTVCDPADPLSLNVVGFDASAPGLISEFAAGRL